MAVRAVTLGEGLGERLRALANAYLMSALALVMISALLVFLVYPVVLVLYKSFEGDSGLTLRNYARFFSTPYYYRSLTNSLILATTTTLLTVAIGFGFAYMVTRGPRLIRMPFRLVALLPLVAPPYIFGIALIILGGRRGLFNQVFGTDLSLYGWPGVIFAQVVSFLPLCYLMIENVLTSLDQNLEDSASDLGAGQVQVLRTVTLPLIAPGLLRASLLVFILSIADFANPALLGGRLPFLAPDAFLMVVGAEYNLRMAAVLCVFLVVPSIVIFLVHHYCLAGKTYTTITGRSGAVEARRMTRLLQVPFTLLCVVMCGAILLPFGVVLMGAFTELVGINNALTLDHFKTSMGIRSVMTSLQVAIYAGVLTAIFGVLLAYVLVRGRVPGRSIVEFLALSGFAIPGTVVGIGYILAFNQPPIYLTGTLWIIVFSMVFRYMPVALEAGISKLAQIDISIEEASADLGASFLTTFRRVVLPLMITAFMAGLVYTFMTSMISLSAVIFLVSPGLDLASVYIFQLAQAGHLGIASAISVQMIGVVFLCLTVLWVIARRTGFRVIGTGKA
ncbi:MAG: iron ABC transporter permease [Chloroflexi bacterium]|nr:iron ABC transporter permease [Chloroflexota bacterium]